MRPHLGFFVSLFLVMLMTSALPVFTLLPQPAGETAAGRFPFQDPIVAATALLMVTTVVQSLSILGRECRVAASGAVQHELKNQKGQMEVDWTRLKRKLDEARCVRFDPESQEVMEGLSP